MSIFESIHSYNSLNFFLQYVFIWQNIVIYPNRQYIFVFNCFHLNGLYRIVSSLFLNFTTQPPIVHLVQFNIIYLGFPLNGVILNLVCLEVLVNISLFLLYRHIDPWTNSLLYLLLFKQQAIPFYHCNLYKKEPICAYLRDYAQKITKFFPFILGYSCKG